MVEHWAERLYKAQRGGQVYGSKVILYPGQPAPDGCYHSLSGRTVLISADEVGLGCLAGALVVCAVRARVSWRHQGLADSKTLSAKKRVVLSAELSELAGADYFDFSLQRAESEEIDRLGVAAALQGAMQRAVMELLVGWEDRAFVVYDGINAHCPPGVDPNIIFATPKADSFLPHCSAASVLAKTYRDREMIKLAELYPGYGFSLHVGYPTQAHLKALRELGPCPIHRRSYAPVAALCTPPK